MKWNDTIYKATVSKNVEEHPRLTYADQISNILEKASNVPETGDMQAMNVEEAKDSGS